MLFSFVITLAFLTQLGSGAPEPGLLPLLPVLSSPTGPLAPVISLIGNIGNADPPKIIWTPNQSPECAKSKGGNDGQLQCCRAAVAGDLPIVVFLANIYGYHLNPNDVNGLVCDGQISDCPGVRMCCQVTALNPLVSLYCADYNPH
ncbi:hypothetical protein SAMD00023353_4800470 [Rosellinia necatrix]|uniref:Hydrophobin n=1 Tax=Rosellinia necatrix TaxID=77044 RepID=A0A1W2TQC2_ROSNE|nr:hypothetical protein SAMD00023353_4800470 [Rosellinia necatrix]